MSNELHPSAERAIAELKKPIRKGHWDSPYVLTLKQRESDADTRCDLLLDAIVKISKGRGTSSDYLAGLAAEALEALDEVDRFIENRNAAAEAAEEEMAALASQLAALQAAE